MERLIELRRGEPDELARLLNWLIEQKDWSATRLVEKRCQATIAESADLLYIVAEAQLPRGDAAAAEQSAGQALKLNPSADEPSLAMHFQTAKGLAERGRFEWATNEWERVIHNAPPHSPAGIAAAGSLAELYHDREETIVPPKRWHASRRSMPRQSNLWSLPDLESGDALALGAVRARMSIISTPAIGRPSAIGPSSAQCLEKALATQSYDIEVLIECYQMPDSPADYRAKIRKLIEKRLCELREQAADFGANPAAASPCNEFAWLAANTEGDLDEALRLSKRSLDLVGEQGAYCDTLARVYFAKGDYAEAVKQQTRAAELLPHMLAVRNQLALFRKKAAEKGIEIEEIDKAEKQSAPSKSRCCRMKAGVPGPLPSRPAIPSASSGAFIARCPPMPTIKLPGVELALADQGAGRPVVLVHGFPMDHSIWAQQVESLAPHCRVITPDLRGAGRSSVTPGKTTVARMGGRPGRHARRPGDHGADRARWAFDGRLRGVPFL